MAPVAVNVTLVPAHTVVDGEAATETVGVVAVVTVTGNVLGVPLPQLLIATTLIVPLVDPTVVVIELVVDVPVQPDGNVHV